MPIVFEEVTGEIVPERSVEPPDAAESQAARPEDPSDTIRRTLELMRERQRRLMAD
jgi:hypothetical protein